MDTSIAPESPPARGCPREQRTARGVADRPGEPTAPSVRPVGARASSAPPEAPPPLRSAAQVLLEQQQRARGVGGGALLLTGLPDVDWLLGGGLATGEVTELFGAPGVGKSQLCMLASASQALFTRGTALYIDTSGQFSAQRVVALANALASREKLSLDGCKPRLAQRLWVRNTTTLPELLGELDALDVLLLSRHSAAAAAAPALPVGVLGGTRPAAGAPRVGAHVVGGVHAVGALPGPARAPAGSSAAVQTPSAAPEDEWARHLRLVVVDSVFSACCGERVDEPDTLAGRQLARLGARLRDLAVRHRLAVLVTNAARFQSTFVRHGEAAPPRDASPPRPALGVAWLSTAHVRVLLHKKPPDGRTVVQLLQHGLTARAVPQTVALLARVYVTLGPAGVVTSERRLSMRNGRRW
jgi:RecA/RadA recombinase